MDFAVSMFYAPAEIVPRLVYLAEGRNFHADSYKNLQKCCGAPGKVETLNDLLGTTNTFLVYSPSTSFYGGISRFTEGGGTVSVKAITAEYALFQVTYPTR